MQEGRENGSYFSLNSPHWLLYSRWLSLLFWTLQIAFCHPQEVLSLCYCRWHMCLHVLGDAEAEGSGSPLLFSLRWLTGGSCSIHPTCRSWFSWKGCVPWGVWWTVFHEAGVMERQPPDQSLLQTQKWLQWDWQCKHPLGLMWLQSWAGLLQGMDKMDTVFMQVWWMPCS